MNYIRDCYAFIVACIPMGSKCDVAEHIRIIQPILNRYAEGGCKGVGFIGDCGGPMRRVKRILSNRMGMSALACIQHYGTNYFTLLYKTMKIETLLKHINKFIDTFYNNNLGCVNKELLGLDNWDKNGERPQSKNTLQYSRKHRGLEWWNQNKTHLLGLMNSEKGKICCDIKFRLIYNKISFQDESRRAEGFGLLARRIIEAGGC